MSSVVSQSQISYEDGFPNAEFNAVNEEERARRRKEEKDLKLKEFMDKTKRSAQAKLTYEIQNKQNKAMDQQMKERERAIKAKDYAKKQREIIKHSSEVKKAILIQE